MNLPVAMAKIPPQVNALYPSADSLEDAMQRIKSKLNLHTPNEIHAAVMMYHNTLLRAVTGEMEAKVNAIKGN